MQFYLVETDVVASFTFCVEANDADEARALAREAGAASIKNAPEAMDVYTYGVRESLEK